MAEVEKHRGLKAMAAVLSTAMAVAGVTVFAMGLPVGMGEGGAPNVEIISIRPAGSDEAKPEHAKEPSKGIKEIVDAGIGEASARAEAEKAAAEEAERAAAEEAARAAAEAAEKAAAEAERLAGMRGPAGEASAITAAMEEVGGAERDDLDALIVRRTLSARDGNLTARGAFICDGDEARELERLFGAESRWARSGSLRLFDGDGERVCSFYLRNWAGADAAYVELGVSDAGLEVLNVIRL